MTADITRFFPDRDTRFHALVRQQGRLPIDAEENFASDIAEWERDDAFVETIAPSGSPDDGFRVTLPTGGPPADFTIAAGSYYLGGARVENPAAITYRGQGARNWLTMPLDAEGANEAIGAARRFLVWLDAIDTVVTATQDAELADPGLGGADGAAAKRMGWRVRATPVAGPGCLAARAQWLVASGWSGLVDPDTGALRSGATLTVGFNPADVDQDLCAPALTPGFLGARNECYRVMISRAGRYVWSRDDAAPLYRVRVAAIAGQPRQIVFLTRPRDEYTRPRAGQTVELIRWNERLPNGQKTGEAVGRFFTVASGYADGAITLTSDVDAATTAWLAGLPASALSSEDAAGEQRYFYLRLWTGGGSGGQPDHPIASGDLTGTGLTLTFGAGAFAGEHWVIAARPDAPSRLLPWALKTGMPAHGPRRHVVPLAFVDLDAGTVIDCRRRFRPLYRLGGCCTVTVGDGENSWGDVSSIADAIARLPASGGEICIGPGVWRENIQLDGRSNIVFTGCGRRTRWLAADGTQPIVLLGQCETITFRRLAMTSEDAPCFETIDGKSRVLDLRIEDCALSTPSGGVVRVTVEQRATIDRCRVESGPMANPAAANAAFAAVTLRGDALVVRNSAIRSLAGATAQALALGGIHIPGGSRDIEIVDNVISDGAGNGVTLGSVRMVTIPSPALVADPDSAIDQAIKEAGGSVAFTGFTIFIDDAGCIHIGDEDPDPDDNDDGTVDVPVSEGLVWRVRIADNRIENCGASGIATFPLLPVNDKGEAAWDAIAVEWIAIEHNDIRRCVLREPAPLPPLQRLFASQGGIALGMAIDMTARGNTIDDIGVEPARTACGIFVGYGEGVRIEHNRIERAGGATALVGASTGGIVVRAALGGALPDDRFLSRTTDRPALFVQGNIVHAPAGRALKAIAMGPVMVSGNRLTGANVSSLFANPLQAILLFLLGMRSARELLVDPANADVIDLLLFDAAIDAIGGDAVSLVNLSFVEEFLLAYSVGRFTKTAVTATDGGSIAGASTAIAGRFSPASFRGGETLFSDNQVSLRGGPGESRAHVSSVLIVTLDDLGFADNQCEVEADVRLAIANALLIGSTLRATGNRTQEAALCIGSLMTLGVFMNTTAMNQSTFLTIARCANTAKLIDTPNLTFI